MCEDVDACVTFGPSESLDVRVTDCQHFMVDPNRWVRLDTKKPYAINMNHIECAIGEYNTERNEYGVRVYFASGKDQWFARAAAKSLIEDCFGEIRFDEWVKSRS